MRSIVLLLLIPAMAAAGRVSIRVEDALARGTPGFHAAPGMGLEVRPGWPPAASCPIIWS
jgi:hypothetical protein